MYLPWCPCIHNQRIRMVRFINPFKQTKSKKWIYQMLFFFKWWYSRENVHSRFGKNVKYCKIIICQLPLIIKIYYVKKMKKLCYQFWYFPLSTNTFLKFRLLKFRKKNVKRMDILDKLCILILKWEMNQTEEMGHHIPVCYVYRKCKTSLKPLTIGIFVQYHCVLNNLQEKGNIKEIDFFFKNNKTRNWFCKTKITKQLGEYLFIKCILLLI